MSYNLEIENEHLKEQNKLLRELADMMTEQSNQWFQKYIDLLEVNPCGALLEEFQHSYLED